jgi:hypothetical protein
MNCEETQIEISSWVDGEIAPWDALPLADHLLGCAACADFYRRARSLDKAMVMAPTPRPARPLPMPPPADGRLKGSRLATWALPLAATVLLAIGGFALGRQAWHGLAGQPEQRLAQQPVAPMTDDRFVGITRELLESDPRYRTEMLRVMAEVSQQRPLEGSMDTRAPEDRANDGEDGERAVGAPGS